jgi:hypothetical protein
MPVVAKRSALVGSRGVEDVPQLSFGTHAPTMLQHFLLAALSALRRLFHENIRLSLPIMRGSQGA